MASSSVVLLASLPTTIYLGVSTCVALKDGVVKEHILTLYVGWGDAHAKIIMYSVCVCNNKVKTITN